MINVTQTAATQIQYSAQQSGINDAVLRIAVKPMQDGSLHYAMGFDDAIAETDLRFEARGVQMVISETSKKYAEDMTIDYVKLDNGEENFIFLNPNDGNFTPPANE